GNHTAKRDFDVGHQLGLAFGVMVIVVFSHGPHVSKRVSAGNDRHHLNTIHSISQERNDGMTSFMIGSSPEIFENNILTSVHSEMHSLNRLNNVHLVELQ